MQAATDRGWYPWSGVPFHALSSRTDTKVTARRADVYRWVTLAHDLVSTVGGRNATITVGPSGDVIMDQSIPYLPDPKDDLRIMGGGPALGDAQRTVGGKYARYPRGGTYLNAEHVAASGGRHRVVRDVRPAAVRRGGCVRVDEATAGIEGT